MLESKIGCNVCVSVEELIILKVRGLRESVGCFAKIFYWIN